MKVLKVEEVLSKGEGERASVRLILEDADDVWTLYNLLEVDDEIRASTTRKVAADQGSVSGSTEKRRVTLTLQATKVEYDGINASVRVSGRNVSSNQFVSLGAYHTTEISRGDVTVTKSGWDAGHREALTAKRKGGDIVAVLLTEEGGTYRARAYALSGSLSRHIASVDASRPKSDVGRDKARDKFIAQLRKALLETVEWDTCRCIALCGADIQETEKKLSALSTSSSSSKSSSLKKSRSSSRAKADGGGDGGGGDGGGGDDDDDSSSASKYKDPLEAAFREKKVVSIEKRQSGVSMEVLEALLADPRVAKLVADTSLAAHYAALENFRAVEAKDPTRVVYGSLNAAKEAAERAAVAKLLLLDEKLKDARDVAARRSVAALIETVSAVKSSEVLVFPKNHVTARRLRNLGGIAAVLHFPCPDLQDITDVALPGPADLDLNLNLGLDLNRPPQEQEQQEAASVRTTLPSAKHVEIKQRPPKSQQPQKKATPSTQKKPPKPKLAAADDDDYCDDDYYDY